jgi:hypothetical protein
MIKGYQRINHIPKRLSTNEENKMAISAYIPFLDEVRFSPRTRPYTLEEINLGYAPAHNHWQNILSAPSKFARLLRTRRLIGYGAFGVVYKVDGAAIKIGCIGESEPAIQQWVYEQHLRALPVWAFGLDVPLPKTLTREICPHHGYLSNLWSRSSVMCHCNEPMSVLVMPIAERADQRDVDDEKISDQIYEAVFEKFGVSLDVHKGNFLNFRGRLMVCDFGDTNDKVADYW